LPVSVADDGENTNPAVALAAMLERQRIADAQLTHLGYGEISKNPGLAPRDLFADQ
jgi:hypothetical protein